MPGFRFSPRSDVFMTPRSFPQNSCYCDGAEKELCEMIEREIVDFNAAVRWDDIAELTEAKRLLEEVCVSVR